MQTHDISFLKDMFTLNIKCIGFAPVWKPSWIGLLLTVISARFLRQSESYAEPISKVKSHILDTSGVCTIPNSSKDTQCITNTYIIKKVNSPCFTRRCNFSISFYSAIILANFSGVDILKDCTYINFRKNILKIIFLVLTSSMKK